MTHSEKPRCCAVWNRSLAVNSQDKETYLRMLQAVIDADPGDDPDIGPENRAEQAKAKRLLDLAGHRRGG